MVLASSTRREFRPASPLALGLLAFILFFAASAGILSAAQPRTGASPFGPSPPTASPWTCIRKATPCWWGFPAIPSGRSMDAKHALFLFDSCFSGAIFKQRDLPAVPPSVMQMTAQPVRQFITAGTAGQSVPAVSTFTPAFVDAVSHGLADLNNDGYISGTELGLYLSEKVPRHAAQTPQYGKISDYNLSRGDFIFVAGGSSVVLSPATGMKTGALKVTAEPQGARIFVNNTDKGASPVNMDGVKPGNYTLRAEKAGFASQSRTVEVEAGRTASVRFYLEPAVRPGRLFVTPTPADATVTVLNIAEAYSPGMELEPGRYRIQAEKEGYKTVTREETLAGGEDVNVSITLNKASAVSGSSGSEKKVTNDLGVYT